MTRTDSKAVPSRIGDSLVRYTVLTNSAGGGRAKRTPSKRKNPYAARAKISQPKLRQLVRYLALDLNATQIARLTNLNRNTVNRYVHALRERIAVLSRAESGGADAPPPAGGLVFARRCVRSAPVEPARGVVVFHACLCAGRIETRIAACGLVAKLRAVMGKIKCDRAIYLDTGAFEPRTEGRAATPRRPAELEAFWAFSRTRLAKFRGTSSGAFELHLKECEFRFNHRQQDIGKLLLRSLREQALF